jgi:outer membrane receptor protein involved in Fe transport
MDSVLQPLSKAAPRALAILLASPSLSAAAEINSSDRAGVTWVEAHDYEKVPSAETETTIEANLTVTARADDMTGVAMSASEGATGIKDLEARPLLRAGEIVETVPGVIATQHSGGGKANQYFLRGFNLDHGTDLSLKVEGMPVNMPTHGHGQGYADLNFLIPEAIESVGFRKGTYSAGVGDFSAAGSADVLLRSGLSRTEVRLGLGADDFQRALVMGSSNPGGGELLAAFDYNHYDGPWDKPNDFTKLNGLLRYSQSRERSRWSITAMGYRGDWQATDQIPERTAGETVPLFGFVDPFPNGDSSRYSLSGEYHFHGAETLTSLGAYLIHYDLNLVSNFTYCLEYGTAETCNVDDDSFQQTDDRLIYGLKLDRSRPSSWGERTLFWRYGIEAQLHDIENSLGRAVDGGPRPGGLIASYDVQELMLGLYGDVELQWTEKVRMLAGVRGDYYDADIRTELVENTGRRDDSIVSPKLSLILGPWSRTEVYLNWGRGFHSNDARGWVANLDPRTLEPVEPADPLVPAQGADVGVRTTFIEGLQSTLTVFRLELDSELVFLGDAATTEPGPPSRRMGIEIANFYRIRPWISLDLDITLTDAEFTDVAADQGEIPGSVGRTLQLGLALGRSVGWFGAMRWRYFGDIPLTEDGAVRGRSSSLVNGRLGYGFSNGLRLVVEGFNLLDREDPDIQYFYASRLPAQLSPTGQTEPMGGVEGVHFHPMESRSVRIWLEYGF